MPNFDKVFPCAVKSLGVLPRPLPRWDQVGKLGCEKKMKLKEKLKTNIIFGKKAEIKTLPPLKPAFFLGL